MPFGMEIDKMGGNNLKKTLKYRTIKCSVFVWFFMRSTLLCSYGYLVGFGMQRVGKGAEHRNTHTHTYYYYNRGHRNRHNSLHTHTRTPIYVFVVFRVLSKVWQVAYNLHNKLVSTDCICICVFCVSCLLGIY